MKRRYALEPVRASRARRKVNAPRPRATFAAMSDLKRVTSLLAGDMAAFKPKFRAAVTTDVALLDTVMRYILRRKGKQMRPMFVFLSARLHGGVDAQGPPRTAHTPPQPSSSSCTRPPWSTTTWSTKVPFAAACSAFKRCGRRKVAVLVGDYLLSRGLLAAVDAEAFDLLKITSRAVREMSEGELLQIEKARRLDITEEVYFDIIRRKTASLLAACCACGAAAAGADDDTVQKMWGLGERVGFAFQIQDDLLDLGEGDRTGKPTGQDIRERKMTLPLIHTLAKASPSERRRLIASSSTRARTLQRSKRSWTPSSPVPAWSARAPRCVA